MLTLKVLITTTADNIFFFFLSIFLLVQFSSDQIFDATRQMGHIEAAPSNIYTEYIALDKWGIPTFFFSPSGKLVVGTLNEALLLSIHISMEE